MVTTEKLYDYFDSPSAPYVGAGRDKNFGFSLNTIAKDTISYASAHYHATGTTNVAYRLGGLVARLLTYHATVGGKKVVIYEVLANKGAYFYDVYWQSLKGNEALDLTLFKEIVGTFAPA